MDSAEGASRRPYPESWDAVAQLRVFRTTSSKWAALIAWRGDMQRKGWKLLKVVTDRDEVIAIFGRTREELLRQRGQAG